MGLCALLTCPEDLPQPTRMGCTPTVPPGAVTGPWYGLCPYRTAWRSHWTMVWDVPLPYRLEQSLGHGISCASTLQGARTMCTKGACGYAAPPAPHASPFPWTSGSACRLDPRHAVQPYFSA
eukprot:272769-Chlamydomonas_euryale.AAC.4